MQILLDEYLTFLRMFQKINDFNKNEDIHIRKV